MYNETEKDELNKEDLINDEQFLDDASEFLLRRTGNYYDNAEDIFENYLNHMRWHSSNDVTPVRDLMFAQKADPKMKDRMARLFSSYDKLESNANDDMLEIAQDYGFSVLSSPSTWLGFLTAGAGKVASLGTQQAARAGVRGLLYRGLTTATSKAPVTSSAVIGATVEGTAGYGQEKARQMARVEVGEREEEDETAIGINTLLTAGLGGAGGALTGALKARQVARAKGLLQQADEASAEAVENASRRADETISANAEAQEQVIQRLRPLDEAAVAEGRELRDQLSDSEMFIMSMDIPTKKAITAAAIDLIGPEDLSRDPAKRITEVVADRIKSGDLTSKAIDDIAEKYNLSREQISLIFTSDVSDAARSLQLVGQLKRGALKKIEDALQRQDGVDPREAMGLADFQSEFIADLANGMGFLARETVGGLKGFERMRRAILTSQPQTTVRNFAGGAARILIDMPETLFENLTRRIINVFSPGRYAQDTFRTDSTSILKFLSPITVGDKDRVTADVIANLFERTNPESAQRLFGTFIDAAYVANKGHTGGFLEGVGGALNFANRFADNYYKKAIFAGELNRITRAKYGKDLIKMIEEGNFNKIDAKDFNKASEKAFELLYQKYPTSKTGAGKLARAYLDLDKQAGSGILMGMLIPFPRFVMNQIEFIYDHAPIIGMLSSRSAPEKIAKQITGMGMIMGAYQMRAAEGEQSEWYLYTNEDGSTTDLRPFLGPLSMPFYLADLLYRHYDPRKTEADNVKAIVQGADARTVSEIMIGSAMRVGAGAYFAETALPELTAWATGLDEDTEFVSSQKFEKAMGRFAGDYVATFSYAMPMSIARDLYKISDEEARLVNETNGQVTFGDVFRVRASRALPQPLKEEQIEKLERRPLVANRFVITSDEATETRDPFTTAVTGLARSRPKTKLEKELTSIGLTSYDLYKPIPFGPADVLVRRELSGNGRMPSLSKEVSTLIDSERYAKSDIKTKRTLLKTISKQYISEVRGQVFDVLLAKARKGEIDYKVSEVMRIKFESEPVDNREMAIVQFQEREGRRPNLAEEKDLKLLIEIAKGFVKSFAVGGFVQSFNNGGLATDPLMLSETVEEEDVATREQEGEDYVKQMTELGLDLAPVTGEIRSAQAAVKDYEEGNYGMAALGALGALPGVGIVGRGAKKAIEKFGPEALDMIPDRVFYHGTMADIDEFDPDLVDIGIHLGGNPTQSSDRLLDLADPYSSSSRYTTEYAEGANIIPLRARMKNTLEMQDVGDWKNSYEVAYALSRHPKFKNNRTVQDIMEEADAEQAFRTDPSTEPFRDSMENRSLLDELRNLIQEKGYDSIQYINAVEGKSQLSKQGEKLRKEVLDKMDLIQDRILKRAEADPNWQVPKPEDYPDKESLEAAIQKWSYDRPDVMSYATKEERLDLADLAMGKKKVEDKYGNDPYSYIVLDPSQLRSALSAKFDPAMRESANLNMNRGGLSTDPLMLSETVEEEDSVAREEAGEEYIKQMTELSLDMAPVTGEIRSFQAGMKDFEEGNPLMGTLGVIGALPIIGIPGRAAKKAIKMAVNVKKDKLADIDYAELLISGDKKFETRNTPSLNPYVGQRVGIAKTGDGEAKAIGSVEIGEPIEVDEKTFRELQDQHLVPEGSEFDIAPGGKKYLYPISNPERFDKPKSVGRGIVSRKILDDVDEATEMLGDEKAIQAWKDANKLPESQRQQRNEIVQQAAKDLSEGKITGKEYRAVVKAEMPIKPITLENFPEMPTKKEIVGALTTDKSKKGIVGLNLNIEDGTRVGSRLDIPAYDNYDTWIVSLHDGTKQGGAALGYGQTAVLNNVEFMTSAKGGLSIAKEKAKSTIARIHGDWENKDPQEVYELAKKLINDPEWKQIGMNPFRHSFFYDKATGKPITRAEQVIQVGPLVLAKGATSALSDLKKLKIKSSDGKVRVFSEGGLMSRK